MKKKAVGFLLVLIAFPCLGLAASPTEITKRVLESIRACGAKVAPASGDQDCNLREIEENLAIEELARWLLGPYWQKVGAEEQKNFTALVTRFLREIGYPKAAEFLADLQIEYREEQIQGPEAMVETTATDPEQGRVKIDYRLHQIEGKWKIWDVRLDEVSMATNLRKQVQSVIAKKSYQELIRRMQKKLEEGL